MGTLPRERRVFALSQLLRFTVRTVGLFLLAGICLALVADPFIATANSPVTADDTSEIFVTKEKNDLATKKIKSRSALANTTEVHKQQRNCTKAQMLQPAPVQLGGSGFVKEHEAPQYYEVFGRSSAEVRKQIMRCSPGEYFAYTSSRLSWKYNFTAAEQGCVITDVSVGIRTMVHYPTWSDMQSASVVDQKAWRRMADGLVLHEFGHVQRSSSISHQMYTALKGMPNSSCDTIAEKAKAIVNSYNTKLKQTHTKYDQQTNHGETQGAVL